MKQLMLKSPAFRYAEAAFREWLDILGYAPSTVYQLPSYIREFFHFLEQKGITQIPQLEPRYFHEYFQALHQRKNDRRGGGLSNSYLNKHLQALYKLAEYLRQSGRLNLPALNIEWESHDGQEITYLSPGAIRALYEATEGSHEGSRLEPMNARDRVILTIFYGCGLRRNEGYHLDISDINLDKQVVHVRKGKGNRERFVPFNETASQYLREWIYDQRPELIRDQRESAFFISQRGRRMDTQSMALRLKVLQTRSDHPELQETTVRLHVLRHSIATHLLQNGMSLEKIGRLLGHTSLESTQVYTHLIENEQHEQKNEDQPW